MRATEHENVRGRRQTTPANSNIAPPPRQSVAMWKAIAALELVFLVFMWTDPFLLWTSPFNSSGPGTFLSSKSGLNIYAQSTRSSNYYYRNYIPTTPTLLIGGTDGSGTRAIAKTMQSLGVVMKLDDPHTLDVHASARFKGWTRIVQQVLKETLSASYELSDLSNITHARLVSVLRYSFWNTVKQYRLNNKRQPLNTTGIFVGIKAPATMLLLPLLQQAIGPIKFIHVVRDGRDISLYVMCIHTRPQCGCCGFQLCMYTHARPYLPPVFLVAGVKIRVQ